MNDSPLALVTGGNRGIGLATAHALAQAGMRVLIGSRDLEDGQRAAADLPGQGHSAVRLDVTERASIAAAVERADELGGLGVLVNNAGVYLMPPSGEGDGPVLETDEAIYRRTFEVNLFGPLGLSQAVLPGMIARGWGRIVNVSSGYGTMAAQDGSGPSAYRLSKLALNGLTRQLAAEAGPSVRVNAVDPGWVKTRMGSERANRDPADSGAEVAALALLPDDGPTGGFFYQGERTGW